MSYQDIVEANIKAKFCPFCQMPQNEILDHGETIYVTLARAPYAKDHLLLVPYREVVFYSDLSDQELHELSKLTQKWLKKLHIHHPDVNILLRDGNLWGNIGKSVNHMHLHLIPGIPLEGKGTRAEERRFFELEEFLEEIASFKQSYQLEDELS